MKSFYRRKLIYHKVIKEFKDYASNVTIGFNYLRFMPLLGKMSHSSDLLVWISARRRLSCIVRHALKSYSQELPDLS